MLFRSAEIPVVRPESGIEVRIICGEFSGVSGPVHGVAANPTYMDIHVAANHTLTVPMSPENNGFAYVFSGSGIFGEAETVGAPVSASQAPSASEATNRTLVLFGEGDAIRVRAGSNGIRFILAFGKPLREPVAWHGPIVMNTQDEIRQALQELRSGEFLKMKA